MSQIVINDLMDVLTEDNKRLFNQLSHQMDITYKKLLFKTVISGSDRYLQQRVSTSQEVSTHPMNKHKSGSNDKTMGDTSDGNLFEKSFECLNKMISRIDKIIETMDDINANKAMIRSNASPQQVVTSSDGSTEPQVGSKSVGTDQLVSVPHEEDNSCDDSEDSDEGVVESNPRSGISRDIPHRHHTRRQTTQSYDSYHYWDKILDTNNNWLKRSHSKSTSHQKSVSTPPQPSDTELSCHSLNDAMSDDNELPEQIVCMPSIDTQLSDHSMDNEDTSERDVQKAHLNISNTERNVLLSCKGLASMSKVREYHERLVIDGQKVFVCKWRGCEFRAKSSQKIAQHINLSHIGVEFRCYKPDCHKVFRNPNTYREHLKNHVCGFGIFGYGSKGVVGVCRNENLNRYRERVWRDGKRYYRCQWQDCGAITPYHMAIKRHLHAHVCPFRKNLKLKQNRQLITDMKSDDWNLFLGTNGSATAITGSPVHKILRKNTKQMSSYSSVGLWAKPVKPIESLDMKVPILPTNDLFMGNSLEASNEFFDLVANIHKYTTAKSDSMGKTIMTSELKTSLKSSQTNEESMDGK